MRKHWSLRYRPWANLIAVMTVFVTVAPRHASGADNATAATVGVDSMDAATGYRIGNYRAPVTLPVEGGTRISISQLDALQKSGAVLIDVMPARAGYDPRTGKWRLIEKRFDIPSSVWLPNVGQGKLEPRLEAYFVSSLRDLTNGHSDRPLVFYCMADCWMSWNAVKRAAAFGYSNVKWFAEGTDGWVEAGRTLVKAVPPPVPAETDARKAPAELRRRPLPPETRR